MAPLAGDGVDALDELAVDDDAAADAGAEDGAEHHRRALAGAVDGFRERETVGVVGDAHRATEGGGQVAAQVAAVQPGGVALGDPPRRAVDRTGDADPHPIDAPAGLRFELVEQPADRAQPALVVKARRRDAGAGPLDARLVENHPLDLGAAVVETKPHVARPPFVAFVLG